MVEEVHHRGRRIEGELQGIVIADIAVGQYSLRGKPRAGGWQPRDAEGDLLQRLDGGRRRARAETFRRRPLASRGTAPAKLSVGETVRRIAIVDDEGVVSSDGRAEATVSFTQAIVLEFESGFLALDKGDWTGDYVHVRRGGDPDVLLTDCSAPWIEGDGWSDAYRRRTTWL